jgi:catechol 2,3-dioxygenase-like lactoylglutathione lyase family enzyme
MASSLVKKAVVAQKRPAAGRKATSRMLIDDVTAILLISPNAKQLCEFYRATLGLPLEEELHDGIPPHYGYSLGDVHFAIHSADGGWPGTPTRNAQSPVITFSTSDLKAVAKRLTAKGIKTTGPTDHGFGQIVSFRDPDGNLVSILEYGPDYW